MAVVQVHHAVFGHGVQVDHRHGGGGEPGVGHGGRAAVGVGHAGGAHEHVAVLGGGAGVGGDGQAGDAGVRQGQQFACVGNAVAIGIAPDAQVGKAVVAQVDHAVGVAVERGQGGPAVGGFAAVGQGGARAQQFGAAVDHAVQVQVDGQQAVLGAHPAGLHRGAGGRQVKHHALGQAGGLHAVAVEVDDQRRHQARAHAVDGELRGLAGEAVAHIGQQREAVVGGAGTAEQHRVGGHRRFPGGFGHGGAAGHGRAIHRERAAGVGHHIVHHRLTALQIAQAGRDVESTGARGARRHARAVEGLDKNVVLGDARVATVPGDGITAVGQRRDLGQVVVGAAVGDTGQALFGAHRVVAGVVLLCVNIRLVRRHVHAVPDHHIAAVGGGRDLGQFVAAVTALHLLHRADRCVVLVVTLDEQVRRAGAAHIARPGHHIAAIVQRCHARGFVPDIGRGTGERDHAARRGAVGVELLHVHIPVAVGVGPFPGDHIAAVLEHGHIGTLVGATIGVVQCDFTAHRVVVTAKLLHKDVGGVGCAPHHHIPVVRCGHHQRIAVTGRCAVDHFGGPYQCVGTAEALDVNLAQVRP